jgi:hypothetical protein
LTRCGPLLRHPKFNIENADLVDDMQEPESTIALEAIAEALETKRWTAATGDGATDSELLNGFGELIDYLEALKKNTSRGSISLSLSAQPPSTSQDSRSEPTNSQSLSGTSSTMPKTESHCEPSAGSTTECVPKSG